MNFGTFAILSIVAPIFGGLFFGSVAASVGVDGDTRPVAALFGILLCGSANFFVRSLNPKSPLNRNDRVFAASCFAAFSVCEAIVLFVG